MTLSAEQIQGVTTLLKKVSEEGILRRFQCLGQDEILSKAHGETVTIADLETEEALIRGLSNLKEGSAFLGEEGYSKNPDLIAQRFDSPVLWVIDPIDGTKNFARGIRCFRVIVAHVHCGETLFGWIYDPLTQDLLFAQKGKGAFFNGRPLPAFDYKSLQSRPGTLHGSSSHGNLPSGKLMQSAIQRARKPLRALASLHCAGAEYQRLALQKTGFAFFSRLMPWDHLAGALIYREAGGVARCLNGADYSPRSRLEDNGLYLCPTEERYQEIKRVLFEGDSLQA